QSEKFQRAAGEIAAIGDAQVHRIDLLAAPQHLVVKVRAGRTPGGADIADDLALAHLNARAHAACETRHVRVSGLIAVGVADADVITIRTEGSRAHDRAVAGG